MKKRSYREPYVDHGWYGKQQLLVAAVVVGVLLVGKGLLELCRWLLH